MEPTFTAFAGTERIASGTRAAVIAALRAAAQSGESRPVLAFEDATGRQVDFDLRDAGFASVSVEEEPRRGPGRPKLGVVSREVTLLPRHWEWLNAQPGGASVALRKLVDAARKDRAEADRVRASQEAAFRFMSAMAGNEGGFEEASRALYAGNRGAFEEQLASWPDDVRVYALDLAAGAFEPRED